MNGGIDVLQLALNASLFVKIVMAILIVFSVLSWVIIFRKMNVLNRAMKGAEAKGLFPGLPEVAPDLQLWALLAADGTPIMLSDSREAAVMNAHENDLETVSIH